MSRYIRWAAATALLVCGFWMGPSPGGALQAEPGNGQGPPPMVDVLIGFHQPPGLAEHNLVRSHGGTVRRSFDIVPAVAATVPQNAVAALSNDRRVKVVEPDGLFHAIEHSSSTGDAELDATWGVKHIGAGLVHAKHQGGDFGDGVPPKGPGVRVAIIDSGIDYNHPELEVRYFGGRNFVHNRKADDPKDDNGHGTHVAGTVAAARDGAGVVGVAPRVELYALKVLDRNGSGSFSNVIAALDWCVKNHIHVTNNSYGSSGDPGQTVRDAFRNSYDAGVLHIAAAGNSGNSSGTGDSVGFPAKYDSVVAVAATDKDDQRASFSSTGPAVEIAAPGVAIRSTVPGGGYQSWNGTSMASPHVAGVAALVLWAGGGAADELVPGTPDLVRPLLTGSALDIGLDANHVGAGLVDAYGAVLAVADPGSSDPGEEDPDEENPDEENPDEGDPSPEEPTAPTASVSAITYATSGGRLQDKDLLVTVAVKDGQGAPIAGATVSIRLFRDGSLDGSGSGTTNTDGSVTWIRRNAPSGTYTTLVTDVTAEGYVWDGHTPDNERTK